MIAKLFKLIFGSFSYKARFFCENCENFVSMKVPKGMTIKEFAQSAKCPVCNCDRHIVKSIY